MLPLVFKALNGLAPTYIADFCVKVPASERCSTLHSAGTYQYNLVTRGELANLLNGRFQCGPAAWNSLPDYIKLSTSVDIFKSRLKSHLYRVSFP